MQFKEFTSSYWKYWQCLQIASSRLHGKVNVYHRKTTKAKLSHPFGCDQDALKDMLRSISVAWNEKNGQENASLLSHIGSFSTLWGRCSLLAFDTAWPHWKFFTRWGQRSLLAFATVWPENHCIQENKPLRSKHGKLLTTQQCALIAIQAIRSGFNQLSWNTCVTINGASNELWPVSWASYSACDFLG